MMSLPGDHSGPETHGTCISTSVSLVVTVLWERTVEGTQHGESVTCRVLELSTQK